MKITGNKVNHEGEEKDNIKEESVVNNDVDVTQNHDSPGPHAEYNHNGGEDINVIYAHIQHQE